MMMIVSLSLTLNTHTQRHTHREQKPVLDPIGTPKLDWSIDILEDFFGSRMMGVHIVLSVIQYRISSARESPLAEDPH